MSNFRGISPSLTTDGRGLKLTSYTPVVLYNKPESLIITFSKEFIKWQVTAVSVLFLFQIRNLKFLKRNNYVYCIAKTHYFVVAFHHECYKTFEAYFVC